MLDFYTARELYSLTATATPLELDQIEYVELEGWVRTNRDNGKIGFIELNDGTYFKNVQIVYHPTLSNYPEVSKILTGSSLKVTGKFVQTPQNKQPFEIEATAIEIEGASDETYVLQKKRHTFEFLRDYPHLRPRIGTPGSNDRDSCNRQTAGYSRQHTENNPEKPALDFYYHKSDHCTEVPPSRSEKSR